MNGTAVSGNISTMFTSTTLVLRINGTIIFNSNQEKLGYMHFFYMNASIFSKPDVNEAVVNATSGYLVTLDVTYETGCAFYHWQQWYLLETSSSIAWIFAGSELAIC